jgi:prenyltransferase beta subunit
MTKINISIGVMKNIFRLPLLLIFLVSFTVNSQEINIGADQTVKYLLSNQKTNGAFGPFNKDYTDLAWTYPAIHGLKLLGEVVPSEEAAFKNGHKAWIEKEPWKNGPWYWSLFQKANLYSILNRPEEFEKDFEKNRNWTLQFIPRKGYIESRNYPEGEFFDMSSLWHLVASIKLLGGEVENPFEVVEYVARRQSPSGGFVDDVRTEPIADGKNAHIIPTYDAVMALLALGNEIPNRKAIIQWVQSCQSSSGGFKWSPSSNDYSNQPDIWYTWAAILTLDALGAKPRDQQKALKWINSLQNADGGFGDRPDWNSRIYSTYYAVHALEILTGNARKGIEEKRITPKEEVIPEGVYSIFQAHHKSPEGGTGMVDTVAAMKFNLIGVKSSQRKTEFNKRVSVSIEEAAAYAKKKDYQLQILENPESYSHKLKLMNGQTADHISNFLIPPNLSKKEKDQFDEAFRHGSDTLTWSEFKKKVIKPIRNLGPGTLFYPELDYTMLNAYMVYDDGLDGESGYNAVPGAHFGNIDWVRHFPYKERWEGVLPIIADGDAHANIIKWKPNLEQYRNIYIAENFYLENYLDASMNGRSVCVIRMPSGEVRYYGAKPAVDYLLKHKKEWQWWDTSDNKEQTWKLLFNGENLEGWEQLGGAANFEVIDGAIVGTSVKGTPNSFLTTKETFKDFILELEVKADNGLNSGIQIRSNSLPEHENGRVHGYQVEIDPTPRGFTGRIWDEARRREWLDTLIDTTLVREAFKEETWNKLRIEAFGDSIKTWVNDIPVAKVKDSMTSKGFIGLQVHKSKNIDQVRWRNIRIKELEY